MAQSDVAVQVGLLRAAFPRENIPPETTGLYVTKLSDINAQLLAATVNRLIEDSKFFPAIAEIRKAAARLAGLLPVSAPEALAIVRRADRREPVYRRDGTMAYTERYWDWPEDADQQTVDVCCEVIQRVGDPVHGDTGKDHFAWETGFRDVYDAEAATVSARMLGDLSPARLLEAGRGPTAAPRLLPSHGHEILPIPPQIASQVASWPSPPSVEQKRAEPTRPNGHPQRCTCEECWNAP